MLFMMFLFFPLNPIDTTSANAHQVNGICVAIVYQLKWSCYRVVLVRECPLDWRSCWEVNWRLSASAGARPCRPLLQQKLLLFFSFRVLDRTSWALSLSPATPPHPTHPCGKVAGQCKERKSCGPENTNPRPLLARGTKAAFLRISGHACQLSGYAFMFLKGPNTREICLTRYPAQDPLHHKKSLRFQTCFQGSENQKNGFQGVQKTTKFDPIIH